MRDHDVVNAVLAHDLGGHGYVVVRRYRIDVLGHDLADGRAVVEVFAEVVGSDDAYGFVVGVDDGNGADPVLAHDILNVADAFMGKGRYDLLGHEIRYLDIHGR